MATCCVLAAGRAPSLLALLRRERSRESDASVLFPRLPNSNADMDELITDITLDHLPDLSDASVSFQIPPNTTATDLLLSDHTSGFDLLCNADDDDASFAPLRVPRGQLGDPNPRVLPTSRPPPHTRSPTPTSASSVILPSLTLGHTSPGKSSHISSSIHRLLQSPLVSEERLDQLRADVVTLGHAESEPTHVRAHVMQPPQHGVLDCPPPSHSNSEFGNDTVDSPPSEDPQPEENDTHHDTQPQSDQDVVMPTREDGPADATVIAAPRPRPKSGRNPRTTAKPVSQHLIICHIYVLMSYPKDRRGRWHLQASLSDHTHIKKDEEQAIPRAGSA